MNIVVVIQNIMKLMDLLTLVYKILFLNLFKQRNSKIFWRLYVTLRTNGFLDFVHRAEI
jgi:hypothetical protein